MSGRGRCGLLGSAVLILVLLRAGAPARAAEDVKHPPIYLELKPCSPVDEAAVRQVLAVELGALFTAAGPPAAGVTQVAVQCDEERLRLQADDPLTGKSLLRRIDLRAVEPSVRARLLGLAIAELVSASWTELMANPQPQVPPAEPEVPPAVRRAALAAVRRSAAGRGGTELDEWRGSRLLASAAVSTFFTGSGLLLGAGVRLAASHAHHLGWSADLLAQHGSVVAGLGGVSIDLLSTGAALLFEHHFSRLSLLAGGGVRGGVAYLSGQPRVPEQTQGGSLLGGWGGPLLTLGVSTHAGRRLVIEAALEGGYVAFSVLGLIAGAPTIAIDGPWMGLQVGIGLHL